MASKPVTVTVSRNPLMGWLADRPVNTKLTAAVLMMAVVALGITVLSVTRMTRLSDSLDTMKATHVEGSLELAGISDGVALGWRAMLVRTVGLPEAVRDRDAADAAVDRAITAFRVTAKESANRLAAVASFEEAAQNFRVLRNVVTFEEKPPNGFTMPAPDKVVPTFSRTRRS